MKTNRFIRLMAGGLLLLSAACTDRLPAGQALAEVEKKLLFTVDRFEAGNATRTYVDDSYNVKWAKGDAVGIFPYEGWQEPFVIPDDQIDQTYATFDGGYWALKEGLTYNAYYPFSVENFSSAGAKNAIPVCYTGQLQDGAAYGVGDYDFTYSDWQTATAESSVTFNFHHIGSLVIVRLTYPATAAYTSLSLYTGSEILIPLKGTYDLTYNKDKAPEEGKSYVKIPFVADETGKANALTLKLANCDGIQGQSATFYMMVPPVDLSNAESLSFMLSDNSNNVYKAEIDKTNFESGKKYEFTLGNFTQSDGFTLIFGNVTVNDWEKESIDGGEAEEE